MIYTIGEHTITTTSISTEPWGVSRQNWQAFLDGDRRFWEAGASEAEAIGKVIQSHFPSTP